MLDEFKYFGLKVNETLDEDLEGDKEDELPDRVASIELFHFLRDQDLVLLWQEQVESLGQMLAFSQKVRTIVIGVNILKQNINNLTQNDEWMS